MLAAQHGHAFHLFAPGGQAFAQADGEVVLGLALAGLIRQRLRPQAQDALGHAHTRHKAGKPLLFTGPELQAVRNSYEFHDLQRQSVSRSQYEQAIEKTANRIRSAHPDLKVYA